MNNVAFPERKPPGGRVLVLGGSGFIGSHLVDALSEAGSEVRSFDRIKSPWHSTRRNVESVVGNFLDADQVADAVAGCDYVYHLVSTTLPKTSNDNPIADVEQNLISTLAMLKAACDAGVKKVVFLSSGGTVYGIPQTLPILETHPTLPMSSYGIVKLTIEHYLHLYHVLHGLDYQVLRLSNPFGERQPINGSQGAIAVFMSKALRGETVEIWGDGSVVRDYVYIADVIDAMLMTLNYQGQHRSINIGSGTGQSINQIIDAISHTIGRPIERRYSAHRSFDVPASVLSIERAHRELGWQPSTSFADGLARTSQWIRTAIAND